MEKNIDSNSPVSKTGIGNLKLNVRKHTADINSVVESEQSIGTPSTIASSVAICAAQAKALIGAFWRSKKTVHQIGYMIRKTKQFKNCPVKDINNAVSEAFSISDDGHEAYFAMAEYITTDSRTASNASGAYGLWGDLDVGEDKAATGKGYKTVEDAKAALIKFCKDADLPEPTHIVYSGGGLHVYWVFSNFINHETWQKLAGKFKALTKSLGFLADPTRTADITSVLRVPGTLNHKYNPPVLVTLKYASDNYIDCDAMLAAIDNAHSRLCVNEKVSDKTSSTTHESIGTEHTNAGTIPAHIPETSLNIECVESALAAIHPDCSREEWLNICFALHSTGWACAESLARSWSMGEFTSTKTSIKYDAQDFDIMWRSSKIGGGMGLGTIFHYAKQAGFVDAGKGLSEFSIVNTPTKASSTSNDAHTTVVPEQLDPTQKIDESNSQTSTHPLEKYTICGMSAELGKYASEEVLILGQIALKGQTTVIYAAPNTGKTLLTIYLLIEAIKQKKIADPSKVFYVNVDDTSNGLLDKLAYAEEYGFHMFAEGYNGFKAKNFLSELEQLTENNQVSGAILVFDTVKKFVNLMDKTKSSYFTVITRKFTSKGGTIIALAHTNKNLSPSGKPVPAGTSDLGDDFDCSYTLAQVGGINSAGNKTVCFENNKLRGNVAQTATYSYSNESTISYTERLMSVEALNQTQLDTMNRIEKMESASKNIDIVLGCITKGINKKMELIDAFSTISKMSKKAAVRFINEYTGDETANHKWSYTVGAHGTKTYAALLPSASAGDSEISNAN